MPRSWIKRGAEDPPPQSEGARDAWGPERTVSAMLGPTGLVASRQRGMPKP